VPLTCCCTIISSSGEATTDESTPEPTAAPIFSELLSSRGTPPVKAFLMAPLRKNCVMTHPALLSVFAKYPARHRSERRLSANVLSQGACWQLLWCSPRYSTRGSMVNGNPCCFAFFQ
jgi:hypothetical protein